MAKPNIPWWNTDFGDEAVIAVSNAVREKKISQGVITEQFEREIGQFLGIPYVIATSSGSTALVLGLMACGVKPGDEVIVPNRTWIATGHAAHLLGAKVVLCDVEVGRPILCTKAVRKQISDKTKAIIPVNMNGRGFAVESLAGLAKQYDISIIEDAAQAFGSKKGPIQMGTEGIVGCFSLSVAKIFSSGQGGFAVTKSPTVATKLRNLRTHGVENVMDPTNWPMPGLNFRFTDMQASVARSQLRQVNERIRHLQQIYQIYIDGLDGVKGIKIIPVDISSGEVPVYNEVLVRNRADFIDHLRVNSIETRPFYPSLHRAAYFDATRGDGFPNSRSYEEQGVYLPSGPGQKLESIESVVEVIRRGSRQNAW